MLRLGGVSREGHFVGDSVTVLELKEGCRHSLGPSKSERIELEEQKMCHTYVLSMYTKLNWR